MCPSPSLSEITCEWSLIKSMFLCFCSEEGGDQALVALLMRLLEEIYPQRSFLFQLFLWWLPFPSAWAEGELLRQQAGDEMLKLFWCLCCWFWQYCSSCPGQSSVFPRQLPLLNQESNVTLSCCVWGAENSLFVLILFVSSLKMPLLCDGGVEENRFWCLKHPKWMVFLSLT